MQAIANNLPELFSEMQPTVAQLRGAARKYGLRPAQGETHRDLPLLSVRGPLVNGAINSFEPPRDSRRPFGLSQTVAA